MSDSLRSRLETSRNLSLTLYKLQPHEVHVFVPNQNSGDTSEAQSERRLRLTVATALFSIALDHHVALILLLQNNMKSSAFALLRSIFDAVWRGAWAAHVADSRELHSFSIGHYDPPPDRAIERLEKTQSLPPVLSKIKKQGWKTMSAYVHSGALQVQRWVGEGIIESQHSDEEVFELLGIADRLAFTACVFFSALTEVERDEFHAVAARYLT